MTFVRGLCRPTLLRATTQVAFCKLDDDVGERGLDFAASREGCWHRRRVVHFSLLFKGVTIRYLHVSRRHVGRPAKQTKKRDLEALPRVGLACSVKNAREQPGAMLRVDDCSPACAVDYSPTSTNTNRLCILCQLPCHTCRVTGRRLVVLPLIARPLEDRWDCRDAIIPKLGSSKYHLELIGSPSHGFLFLLTLVTDSLGHLSLLAFC
jgi:hypothetical protein